jgi:hypothetical protein
MIDTTKKDCQAWLAKMTEINVTILSDLITYKIGVGEGTFAIHLLVSEITPTKKWSILPKKIVKPD